MQEIYKFLIGILFLALAFPIGNLLAKKTKEELKQGQKWFKLLLLAGFVGAIGGVILGNDVIFFSFLFIAIVTSRSLKIKKKS